nr:hypothetical protein [Curtanaerobium respiraculi]
MIGFAGTTASITLSTATLAWEPYVTADSPLGATKSISGAIAPEILPADYSLRTSLNTSGFSTLWPKVSKDGTGLIDDNADETGCEQGISVDVFAYCQLDENPDKEKKRCGKARTSQLKSYLKHFPARERPLQARSARARLWLNAIEEPQA